MLLGLRGDKLPTNPELQYMVNMLKEDYGNLPIGELDLAFELMVKGKLDEAPETYQNFSVLYLSRMMTSYARFVIANYQTPKKELPQLEAPKPDEDELLEFIITTYQKQKDKTFDRIFMGLDAFRILNEKGQIEFNPEEVYERTLNELKARATDRAEMRRIKELINDEDRMEAMCRRMAVKIHLDKIYISK